MRSATRDLVNAHASAAEQPVRHLDSKLSQASSSVRTRLLHLAAVGLAVVALVLSAISASAEVLTVTLPQPPPQTPLVNAGCSVSDEFCDAVAQGSLGGGSGQFMIDEHGVCDLLVFTCLPVPNKMCFQLTGTTTLTFGADILVLVSRPATDTVCATEPGIDDNGIPLPGQRTLTLTFTVDPDASQGKYHKALGSGSLEGTWTPFDPNLCPDCAVHLSDELALIYNDVSIPNLLLDTTGGCVTDCGNGNGNPGATPELDSILLFGSGLSGFVAYAVRRRRAGMLFNSRKHSPPTED